MRSGVVEELREREAKVVQPRPIQVAQNDALLGFASRGLNQLHLRAEIFPGLAVVDESVDPFPELRVHRVMEFALPPKIKRQIGIELRKNHVRQEPGAWAFEQEGNLFRANLFAAGLADVAMGADPGFDAILFRVRVRANDNGAAGMVARDFGDQFCVLFERARFFTVNRKVCERGARHRPGALRPKLLQFDVDLADLDLKA